MPARERIEPEGVALALGPEAVRDIVQRVRALAPDVVVVALLHAYADPRHEQAIAAALRSELSEVQVVMASEVFPEIREYERTSTAVAEAYLRPECRTT